MAPIATTASCVLKTLSWSAGIALLLFFIAGFSDGLDGFLAKRFNWHTRIGALLDPIADKILVATALLLLDEVSYGQHSSTITLKVAIGIVL